MKTLPNHHLDGLKDFMKQKRAHKMRLKHLQDGVRLSLKSTLRNKRNRTKEKRRNHSKIGSDSPIYNLRNSSYLK
jgi:hypothetical protein